MTGGAVVLGGAALLSSRAALPQASTAPGAALIDGYRRALDGVLSRWWNPKRPGIRSTYGGGDLRRTGLLDPGATPSFWQMESLENALFNDHLLGLTDGMRRRLADQWRYSRSVPAFTPKVLAGDGRGVTIALSDDAAWQCWYLMHVHIATGDVLALRYLGEATAFTRARFADRAVEANPSIVLGRTPAGAPIATSRYGILYAVEGEPLFALFGKISSSYEAVLALAELYVHEKLGIAAYRDCALLTFRWIRERLRTPPQARAAAATGLPAASRKAEGLYETELCLARTGGAPQDRHAGFLQPTNAVWGKPIRALDSTYINGAMAMALLGARLAVTPGIDAATRAACRKEAVHIANTLPRLDAYGRDVEGKRLIANTRDPWTDAHLAVPFVLEVPRLPGVDPAVPRAFADTAAHILAHAHDRDGRLTADWAGPERNFTTGRSTWQADYAANPGQQAGAVQIMTEGQTLAMIQARIAAARLSG